MDPLDFSGRTVLVVGGSSGIGNGVAQAFRARGADVHVWGTRAAAADYDPAEGSDLTGLTYAQVDVENPDNVAAAAPAFDRLDVLVLVQGAVIAQGGEFDMAGFRRMIDLNLNSVMACAVKFRPMLAASSGAIVTVASTSAYKISPNNPAYTAAKAGLVSLTKTLGSAWAREGIRVNGIAPGFVATRMARATLNDPQRLASRLAAIPAGRVGTPADMAGVVLFLASPLAAYVVGQTLLVDGGLTL